MVRAAPTAPPAEAAPAPAPAPPSTNAKPPPPPLVSAYADLTLRWKSGKITVEKVQSGRFATPTALRRFVGRFEVRVLAQGKQVDALRFDFPLLGNAEEGNESAMGERIRKGLDTRVTVRVPLPDGADSALLVDRLLDAAAAHPLPLPLTGPAAQK